MHCKQTKTHQKYNFLLLQKSSFFPGRKSQKRLSNHFLPNNSHLNHHSESLWGNELWDIGKYQIKVLELSKINNFLPLWPLSDTSSQLCGIADRTWLVEICIWSTLLIAKGGVWGFSNADISEWRFTLNWERMRQIFNFRENFYAHTKHQSRSKCLKKYI